ncbi:methionyl-tRNA formyltransferase [Corynebacterium timonense]|uniref:Methionyl-tRNA formyltransferase n=1 Tax=Corynebacterium timonense TaxID=441500 RepID=A0A1H1NT95_9CORY|nr:methionyl-tRNA formyltransferase [Corynebacterium timonense]SDS02188.1 methionyl-tRNA formyltransferase [Corynebacterium timonense]
MRLVFAGTPEPAVVSLEKLIRSDHEVVAVLTRPDARRGRGRSVRPSPVKELALEHSIEVLTPDTLRDDATRRRLEELAPEAIPVVAYGNLVPEDLLALPTHGWVNLHFSLLPAWRGASPVQAAIAHGDATTGATTFRIDAGLDTGDILGTVTAEIGPRDTADDVLARLAEVGGDLLVDTMTALDHGAVQPTVQPDEGTYAGKIHQADARVEWTQPAEVIDRRIRAHTPVPGAWTTWGQTRLKLGPVELTEGAGLDPGEVRREKNAVYVGTATTEVRLGLIQPPGKKMMEAAAWARGLNADVVETGVVFE